MPVRNVHRAGEGVRRSRRRHADRTATGKVAEAERIVQREMIALGDVWGDGHRRASRFKAGKGCRRDRIGGIDAGERLLYYTIEGCGRVIAQQNPRGGDHSAVASRRDRPNEKRRFMRPHDHAVEAPARAK